MTASAAPEPMLLRNAMAIMTGSAGPLARVPGPDIRIDRNGRIASIGKLDPAPGERVLDVSDCVVYPGWINTHHHLAQSVLKGVPGDGEGYLLIDDLVDTGRTAREVRRLLPKAYFATLYAKPAGRAIVDTFVKEFKQSKWIHFPWDIDYRFATPIKEGGRVLAGPG